MMRKLMTGRYGVLFVTEEMGSDTQCKLGDRYCVLDAGGGTGVSYNSLGVPFDSNVISVS
jgi:hypothetical protein